MAEKIPQELKILREKVNELEEEMSVSTKTNNFSQDIYKSKRLLLYRYALLLQIKDLRKERRKIETRINKLNTLKAQSARGRMLTNRELEAINHINVDIRKREDVAEEYDNKKEIYSDKRLVYYGMDDELIKTIYKHIEEFGNFFEVTEKKVNELKKQLDESNNVNEKMDTAQILSANEDRYGDEVVDFELGIIFDVEEKTLKQKVEEQEKIEEHEIVLNNEDETSTELDKTLNDIKEIKEEHNEQTEIDDTKKFNYFNGYNLYKEDMEEIIFDSIDQEVEEDLALEAKTVSDKTEELLKENFEVSKEDKFKKDDFLNEQNENVANNVNARKINLTDDDIFKKSGVKKTARNIKDKLALKEKLENYINQFGNDMTREYYNNELRNTTLDSQDTIDKIDKALNYDIYELGILYVIDQKIKKKKLSGDDGDVKFLINQLYQIKMQYKLFPGFCYNDVKEFDPEEIVSKVREFDNNETQLDPVDMYRAANNFTISVDTIKQRYREMYNLNNQNTDIIATEKSDEEDIEVTNE